MLKITRWTVPAHLSRHIGGVVHVSGTAGPPTDYLLPDTSGGDIAIHLGDAGQLVTADGSHRQPSRLVVGALDRATQIRHGSSINTVFVSLPAGCGCVLGVPAAALRNSIAPLDAVAPALDVALRDWADAYSAGYASAQMLIEALAGHLQIRCDRVVRKMLDELGEPEPRSVTSLADTLGLSRRQIDRRFADTLGRTPREYRRIARFARAWRLAGAGRVKSWAALATSAGYFDQAHLIRDFRLLTRETPKAVFPEAWYAAFEPAA
jgi:AraC-like DNA-binding protein